MASNKLAKLTSTTTKSFLEKVKEQYVEKYAQDVVLLMEDKEKLEKALETVNRYIKRIEGGDITAIKAYLKKRTKLEEDEDEELD